MNHKDYNAVRLDRVTDKQWREALDELTVYLNWRLAGKTKRGAHSEKELVVYAIKMYYRFRDIPVPPGLVLPKIKEDKKLPVVL